MEVAAAAAVKGGRGGERGAVFVVFRGGFRRWCRHVRSGLSKEEGVVFLVSMIFSL